MINRLDELLLGAVTPRGVSADSLANDLRRAAAPELAHAELVRIVHSWPDKDSPLSRFRVHCVLKHLRDSLPLTEGSLGLQMLKTVEKSIPASVAHMVHLHEMGFASFVFAHDLYERTLKTFWREKNVDLDRHHRLEMFEIYLLAVYHMSRARLRPDKHRELILFGVHDSYNFFYRRAHGFPLLRPDGLVQAYQSVIDRWIASAQSKRQSPSYALVRTVFNLLGLTSPMDRIACASLLEAGANHLFELSEALPPARVSAGM